MEEDKATKINIREHHREGISGFCHLVRSCFDDILPISFLPFKDFFSEQKYAWNVPHEKILVILWEFFLFFFRAFSYLFFPHKLCFIYKREKACLRMKSKPEKLLSNCREGGKIKMFST
jgi:hypothetical protein